MNSDGDRVAIGAVGNDGNGSASGHVRVYEYSGGSWSQLGSDIDGEAVSDQSGISVSMNSDGDRVAIGADIMMVLVLTAGHVRCSLEWKQWTQLGRDIDGEAAGDNSGTLFL